MNSARVMPAEDLSFVLEHQIGPTIIAAEPPPGWHLKAVFHGGRDVTDQPIEFRRGGQALQVVLTQRAASISGVVRSSRGSPVEASVVLFSDDPELWREHASTTRVVGTTVEGRFTIEGVRAGTYLLVATIKEEGRFVAMPPSYFELLTKHGTRITVGESDAKTVELTRVGLR